VRGSGVRALAVASGGQSGLRGNPAPTLYISLSFLTRLLDRVEDVGVTVDKEISAGVLLRTMGRRGGWSKDPRGGRQVGDTVRKGNDAGNRRNGDDLAFAASNSDTGALEPE